MTPPKIFQRELFTALCTEPDVLRHWWTMLGYIEINIREHADGPCSWSFGTVVGTVTSLSECIADIESLALMTRDKIPHCLDAHERQALTGYALQLTRQSLKGLLCESEAQWLTEYDKRRTQTKDRS